MKDKELIQKIKQLKSIQPDPQWKEKLAEELIIRAQSTFPLSFNKKRGFLFFKNYFSFSRLIKVSVSLLVIFSLILGSSIFIVQAAENSLPGDFLYPVKITKEKVHLALTYQPEKKLHLILEFADNRLEEAEKLAEKKEDGEKIVQVMDSFQKQIEEAKERLIKLRQGSSEKVIKETGFKVKDYQKVLTRLEKEPFLEEEVKNKIKIALNSSESLFGKEEKNKDNEEEKSSKVKEKEKPTISLDKREKRKVDLKAKIKKEKEKSEKLLSSEKTNLPKLLPPEEKRPGSSSFVGRIKKEKIEFKGLIIKEKK